MANSRRTSKDKAKAAEGKVEEVSLEEAKADSPAPEPAEDKPKDQSSGEKAHPISGRKPSSKPAETLQMSKPKYNIVSFRRNVVRVSYWKAPRKAHGQPKEVTVVIPPHGLQHGQYPEELLDQKSFLDLEAAQIAKRRLVSTGK